MSKFGMYRTCTAGSALVSASTAAAGRSVRRRQRRRLVQRARGQRLEARTAYHRPGAP